MSCQFIVTYEFYHLMYLLEITEWLKIQSKEKIALKKCELSLRIIFSGQKLDVTIENHS